MEPRGQAMKLALRGAVAAALVLLSLTLVVAPAAAKKKGGAKTRTISSGPVNLAIPDDPGVNASGVLQTQLAAPKVFKGRKITDVNVGLRVTHPDIGDLQDVRLTAPNGATLGLVFFSLSGDSFGAGPASCDGTFLTLDDESPFELPGAGNPAFYLQPPYAGTAQPGDIAKPLSIVDGGPARGTWTLTVLDIATGDVGALHCWQLRLKGRR